MRAETCAVVVVSALFGLSLFFRLRRASFKKTEALGQAQSQWGNAVCRASNLLKAKEFPPLSSAARLSGKFLALLTEVEALISPVGPGKATQLEGWKVVGKISLQLEDLFKFFLETLRAQAVSSAASLAEEPPRLDELKTQLHAAAKRIGSYVGDTLCFDLIFMRLGTEICRTNAARDVVKSCAGMGPEEAQEFFRKLGKNLGGQTFPLRDYLNALGELRGKLIQVRHQVQEAYFGHLNKNTSQIDWYLEMRQHAEKITEFTKACERFEQVIDRLENGLWQF